MADLAKADFRDYARALGTVMDFAAGQVLFQENDPPRYVYFVLQGSVDVSIRGRVIETIEGGQAVGLLAFVDNLPRTVTATAREACELALIDQKKFRYMVESLPGFVWYVLGELGTRLRKANAAL